MNLSTHPTRDASLWFAAMLFCQVNNAAQPPVPSLSIGRPSLAIQSLHLSHCASQVCESIGVEHSGVRATIRIPFGGPRHE